MPYVYLLKCSHMARVYHSFTCHPHMNHTWYISMVELVDIVNTIITLV